MFERRNDKHGTGRLRTALAIAAVTAVVASMAIVGTVAAQPGQRFLDVPRTHYAYDAVNWAVDNKITLGCGDGRNFCPDDTLNRAYVEAQADEARTRIAEFMGAGELTPEAFDAEWALQQQYDQ